MQEETLPSPGSCAPNTPGRAACRSTSSLRACSSCCPRVQAPALKPARIVSRSIPVRTRAPSSELATLVDHSKVVVLRVLSPRRLLFFEECARQCESRVVSGFGFGVVARALVVDAEPQYAHAIGRRAEVVVETCYPKADWCCFGTRADWRFWGWGRGRQGKENELSPCKSSAQDVEVSLMMGGGGERVNEEEQPKEMSPSSKDSSGEDIEVLSKDESAAQPALAPHEKVYAGAGGSANENEISPSESSAESAGLSLMRETTSEVSSEVSRESENSKDKSGSD
ncbi:hypothetical protein DFH06DRAFT_1150304 [Mycena polygramma]|nr:hypothetical protein DFH06DRAFT_1150304 [Mycena polygramma]